MSKWVIGGGESTTLNVKNYGATGDGVTDDSAAFAAAVMAAKTSRRTLPSSLQPEQSATVVIEVPPGDYLITDPGAVMGDEGMASNGRGLTFRGTHSHACNLIFQPATPGTMLTNDYWMFVRFEHLGFLADTADSTFLLSNTTHAAQRFSFLDCRWENWKYGVDLRGTDNNSEFSFDDCHVMFHQNDGVFFYVGASGSDQFLNYWFRNMSFWGTQATFLDMTYGGSVHISNLDASAWGSGLASTKYLFALRGVSHNEGVCNFEVNGLRWEAMSANARLLYSEWPQGNVNFRNVDMSSQTTTYTYGDIIYILDNGTDGPIYSFESSQLAGGVQVKMSTNGYQHAHVIVFDRCTWQQKVSPSNVVTYDTSAVSGTAASLVPVQFTRCRSRRGCR